MMVDLDVVLRGSWLWCRVVQTFCWQEVTATAANSQQFGLFWAIQQQVHAFVSGRVGRQLNRKPMYGRLAHMHMCSSCCWADVQPPMWPTTDRHRLDNTRGLVHMDNAHPVRSIVTFHRLSCKSSQNRYVSLAILSTCYPTSLHGF
jgi:hypothetical protein